MSTFTIDETALIAFLERYVAARSYSAQEAEAAAVLTEELTRLGFSVKVDDWGNVIGTLRLGEGPVVLIDCHMDTVVVTDESAWTKNPWGELSDDGRFYGRGTADMKGPTAAAIFGLAALRDGTMGTLAISGTVGEELAEGPALVKVCERVQPDYVITAEATDLVLNRGQRGRAEVLVSVHGKSSHSAHPTAGINAAQVMADVITALRDIDIVRHDELGEGILVLTDVVSRPYPGLSVQPDLCQATYDRRLIVGETEEDVLAPVRTIVEEVCAKHGTTGSVEIAMDDFVTYNGKHVRCPNFAPAWLTSVDSTLVANARAALADEGLGSELGTYKFCTNASGSAGTLGIPSIGYGPGEEDQAHTVDESIALADLTSGARGFAAIVTSILTTGAAK